MSATFLHALCVATLLPSIPAPGTVADSTASGRMSPTADGSGRFQTEVRLNGNGPYWFLVDTAATASVMSPDLAARLQLRPDGHTRIVGGIGAAPLQSVSIDDYRSDVFDRQNERMTLLPGLSSDGVVGMNAFTSRRLEFDLADGRLRVGDSGQAPQGFLATQGTLRHGILLVDVVIDGVRAEAMVDTGAPYSIGNPALQAALGLRAGDDLLEGSETLVDTLSKERPAVKSTLGKLAIGGFEFMHPTMHFAAMPIFKAMDLDGGPALILGIDQFAHLEAIAIDYPRAEFQLRP